MGVGVWVLGVAVAGFAHDGDGGIVFEHAANPGFVAENDRVLRQHHEADVRRDVEDSPGVLDSHERRPQRRLLRAVCRFLDRLRIEVADRDAREIDSLK